MAISLQPFAFVWCTCFHFCIKVLDLYFQPTLTAGASDPNKCHNSATAYSSYNPVGDKALLCKMQIFYSLIFNPKWALESPKRALSLSAIDLSPLPSISEILSQCATWLKLYRMTYMTWNHTCKNIQIEPYLRTLKSSSWLRATR